MTLDSHHWRICVVNRRTKALVAAWLATHRSENTRSAYERDLATFSEWCKEKGRDPLSMRTEDLDRFRDDALSGGASAATVTRRLSGVASFFRFAKASGALTGNPADTVQRPQREQVISQTLDETEMNALVGTATTLGPKTAALVTLLGLDGMKLREVLAINLPEVHLDGRKVVVAVQRRGDWEEVEVASRTGAALTSYVAKRRQGPLFLGDSAVAPKPSRLTRFGADFMIKRAGAAAGITKPVSANVLRRSYIEAAHRAGTPLREISDHVGHRDARETARLLEDRS